MKVWGGHVDDMTVAFFFDVTSYSLVKVYWLHCLHYQCSIQMKVAMRPFEMPVTSVMLRDVTSQKVSIVTG